MKYFEYKKLKVDQKEFTALILQALKHNSLRLAYWNLKHGNKIS